MGQRSKSPGGERFKTTLSVFGFLLAVASLSWQYYTYRETHEESPMVRASLTQEWGPGGQLNADKHGKLNIEITNLGQQTMHIKNITLSAWKRVWIIRSPEKRDPTVSLGTGQEFSREIDWDYVKYPIFTPDESEPADFLVEIETTRAVHQDHVQIHSITVTSSVPSR